MPSSKTSPCGSWPHEQRAAPRGLLHACWRLCDQTAGTGFTSVVEAAIPEQPCELAYLS